MFGLGKGPVGTKAWTAGSLFPVWDFLKGHSNVGLAEAFVSAAPSVHLLFLFNLVTSLLLLKVLPSKLCMNLCLGICFIGNPIEDTRLCKQHS